MPQEVEHETISRALERRLPALTLAYRASRGGRGPSSPGLSRDEIAAVGSALLGLQRGLTGSRELAGSPYMDDPELLGAYLLYYWPVSYVQTALALAELSLAPRRVLDLGSGPGPAAAAAFDAARLRGVSAELLLVDGSGSALELAQRVLRGGEGGIAIEARALDLESELPVEVLGSGGPFDLILLGHCLNELWRGREDRLPRRLALLERATTLLAPGGALLVLEPALLATSREALALRDGLAERGYPILGPCPASAAGAYPCPALAAGPDRTCHSESTWDPPEPVASLALAAGLDRRSVKACFFAAGPKGGLPPREAAEPESPNVVSGRVVSEAMLNKAGRLRYFVCSGGELATVSALRDGPATRSSGFDSLRRGDRLRLSGAEARPGGGLGLVPDSRLEILGRAPRIGPDRPAVAARAARHPNGGRR